MRTRIMYLEDKSEGEGGRAWIGRVAFSKTGMTVTYAGRSFRRIKGGGIRGNYAEVETGHEYWISGPKKDGGDRLFGALPVEVDEDVREEYWSSIRGG